jgi:hypothetical protein
MLRKRLLWPALLLLIGSGYAASKPHLIELGKWRAVKTSSDSGATADIKVRRLLVDGKAREYTTGLPHEVTDRLFVIRRAYRLNDSLPEEPSEPRHWTWQLGSWISVDRLTGHIAQLNLPAYDPQVSDASWYRDYIGYCGTSDDGNKVYMMVAQLGRRKPILKKEFAGTPCLAPRWERKPSRVIFALADGTKTTFVVQGRSADVQPESAAQEDGSQ